MSRHKIDNHTWV